MPEAHEYKYSTTCDYVNDHVRLQPSKYFNPSCFIPAVSTRQRFLMIPSQILQLRLIIKTKVTHMRKKALLRLGLQSSVPPRRMGVFTIEIGDLEPRQRSPRSSLTTSGVSTEV